MQVLPIDLTAIIATVMGISIVLIPVIGLTARFALKPTVEALGRFLEKKGTEDTVSILERRVAFLEQHVDSLEGSVRRVEEVTDFNARLKSGAGPPEG